MNKPLIALVEDDDILAGFLEKQLKQQNMDIVHYSNGLDAVKGISESKKIDLILLDISLPDMDGFEILNRLDTFQKEAQIPVVIISNFSQEKDIEWGKKLGVKSFLNKVSVTPVEIVNLIEEIISKK